MTMRRGAGRRSGSGAGAVWTAAFVLGAALPGAGAAWGQNGEPPVRATVIALERPALEAWLNDPKDKRLAAALGMIPARVRELPGEFPDFPAEAVGVINLVLTTISRPASFVLTYDGDNPEGVAFGYGAVLSIEMPGEAEAKAVHASIGGMMAAGPAMPTQPSGRWPGMTQMTTPIGPLSYGPRQAKRGWRYEVIVGLVKDPDSGLESLPRPEAGLTPTVRGRFDFAGLTPVMSMAQAFAPPDPGARFFFEGTKEAGFWGPDAIKLSLLGGHTADEGRLTLTWEGAKRFAEAWHTSAEPLGAGDFAAVPADAVWAGLGKGDFSWLEDLIGHLVEENAEASEGFERFRAMTGVDLRADVLAALGGTMGFYTSDSTGGGTVGSAVVLTTFKDRARFMEAHAKLAAFANAAAEQVPEPMGGHFKITGWKDGEIELYSARFPGLPLPLEPTWAATDRWLIVGVTPQAAVAAARQVSGKGDKGLKNNASFSAAMPQGLQPISVGFLDTGRMLRTGYPLVSLLGSAIANGVRSPVAPERDPGMIVPTFHELAKGARATVQLEYWRGDDLISETRGDRSVLVSLGSAGGAVVQVAPFIAAAAGGAAGAREKAMELHREHGEMGAAPADAWLTRVVMSPSAPPFVREQALLLVAGLRAHGHAAAAAGADERP